jgi:hypothetical protein
VAPLASDPDVQQAVTNRVTKDVLARIDVEALVKQISAAAADKNLPPQTAALLNNLTGPITSGLNDLVATTVHAVVSSSRFETVWVNANRRAHTAMVKALTGEGGVVSTQNDQVTIDVGPIVADVKAQLVDAGLTVASKIPTVHTSFVVFSSKDVGKVRTAFRVLQIMGTWLPVITVLIAAGGVFLATNRRRGLVGAAVGVLAAMVVLAVALAVLRSLYLDRLPAGTSEPAARTVYDTLARFLRASALAVGALALATAIGALAVGPSRAAVFVRRGCRTGIGAVRQAADSAGMRLGPVGRFVHRYKRWLGALILVVAAVVLFTWSYPTAVVVAWTAVIVLAAFAIREFLDTGEDENGKRSPAGDGSPPGGAHRAGA